MAFDESLAARVRDALARTRDVEERRMFGGLVFLLGGHMLVGVWRDSLVARVGPDSQADALREPHVRRFDATGRPMRGWVVVGPDGVEDDGLLADWIDRATAFVATLPRK